MTDGKTFRESVKEEIAKLKKMNAQEKRQYIWEYYKLHLLILGVMVFLSVSIFNLIFNPPKREYLYVAWLGPLVDPAKLSELAERLEPIVDNPERERILVVSYAATDNPALNNDLRERFGMLVQLGSIDVIMTTRVGVEELTEIGWVRTEATSLSGAPLLEAVGFDTKDLYLAVLANTQKFEQIAKALELMFDDR
jgi:hypothetical protein